MLGGVLKRSTYSLLNIVPHWFNRRLYLVERNKHHYLFDANMLSAYWNQD
jgi:hypothetical protein